MTAEPRRAPGTRDRLLWPTAICLIAFAPILELFTRSRIFYVRDLSFFFWSRHLWLRHTLASGTAPWWDPYVAGGQSAIADALNQTLMPLTLAIRLLPSDVVSFNLWVALPLPLAALGMYLFLERSGKPPASAALGACVFTLSGVTVSMLNTPNLAWSIAALPWVMWTTERLLIARSAGRLTALAVAFGLQALSGEPVTGAATALVVVTYAAYHGPCSASQKWSWQPDLPQVPWVAAGIAAGALLAAGQLVPTFVAGVNAHRGALPSPDFWSAHPLTMLEFVAPHLFGNYYDSFLADIPWMTVLNSGRDPFFYSLYVGPIVLLLAAVAVWARPRRAWFWVVIGIAFMIAAFGGYTPVYPLVRKLVPPLAYFRFPVKYLSITVFACAVLAAEGWDALRRVDSESPAEATPRRTLMRITRGAAILAVVAALAVLAVTLFHQVSWNRAYALASWLKISHPDTAADLILRLGPPLFGRAAGLLLAGAALLGVASTDGPRARAAVYLLFLATAIDLGITNGGLSLTTDVEKLMPPAWYTRLSSGERLYIGGRVRGFMNTADMDAAPSWKVPAESTAVEGRMELNAELPMAPSGWRVREALSYDLPVLWPSEYEAIVRTFEHAGRRQRDAFLRRSGVRWCVRPSAPLPPILEVAHWETKLFECGPTATRVFSTTTVSLGSTPDWQRAALFDPDLPDDVLRMAGIGVAAGILGKPEPLAARIVEDGANEVTIEAGLPTEGFVVLRDTLRSVLARDGRRAASRDWTGQWCGPGDQGGGRAPRDTVSLPAARACRRSNDFRNGRPRAFHRMPELAPDAAGAAA